MILEKQKESIVIEEGTTQETIGMSLDLDSAQMLMQMLSKNLYSDSIGSTIRETASNALDSHRKANITDPIIVSFKENNAYNYEYSVEDFGLGLDDDDVRNIISKYGKSTKRQEANSLGMWGLGFKSPLAYSSSFYFICRKNGIERKYMMYEGEDTNTIDLLYENSTEERNGVKVIVPVDYYDRYTFVNKIKEQLCYFEGVYFDVKDIDNSFSITRNEHFQFSELSTSDLIHICLDNVYYPLDFDKVGMSRINLPIGIRFSLQDGIFPTPNRENIRYTQEAIEIIKNKINVIADYFVNDYNKKVLKGNDLQAVIDNIKDKDIYIKWNDENVNISGLIKYSQIPLETPKLNNITILDFNKLYKNNNAFLLRLFNTKYIIKNNKIQDATKSGYNWTFTTDYILTNETKVYIYSEKLSTIKKDYLRSLNDNKHVVLVSQDRKMELGTNSKFTHNSYYHLLDLKNYSKDKWRTVINEYLSIVKLLSDKFINLDELVVPQDFIDNKKANTIVYKSNAAYTFKRRKIKGEINGKVAQSLARWNDGRNCKFVSTIYDLEKLENAKHLKIYTHHDDYLKLDALFRLLDKQKIELVTFSTREMNIVKDLEIHNLIPLEKFMKGNTAPFKRVVTAYLINKLIKENDFIFAKKEQIGYTCLDLEKKLETLKNYSKNNWTPSHYSGGNSEAIDFMESMVNIAKENNLFDGNIYSEYLEMKEILSKLGFLQPFLKVCGYYNKTADLVSVMNDLFKYHKYKINLEHYSLKINEEVLTEEKLEELI